MRINRWKNVWMGVAFVEYLIMGFLFAVNVGLGKKKNTKEVKEGYIIKKRKKIKSY